MWAERSRKRLWRSRLLDVMLWQICPQGLAKANTEDNSWLLNSEGNLAGIFVEGKETDFALLLQVRRRKTFRIKKDQKNHSKKVDNCPKTGRSQARNLEIKTDWNRPFTNYKPWPLELFEMTIYCLRGPLSWGQKIMVLWQAVFLFLVAYTARDGFATKSLLTTTQYHLLCRIG